jgi:hypothetical protein
MKGVDTLIATVLILIISITAIFLALQLGGPSTQRTKEILLMQEGKNTLSSIDNSVKAVLTEGEGSTRVLRFSVSGGNYKIDNTTSSITFSMDSFAQIIAEGTSKIEDGINFTGEAGMVYLNLSYDNIQVTGEAEFGRGYHTLTIRNNGYNSTTQKQMIYISLVPQAPPTVITFTNQYNQTQTLNITGKNTSSPNNLNDLGINTYNITESLESGDQSNYYQGSTTNITGFNTTSLDYTNSLDNQNYNVTSTIGQFGGTFISQYNQTSSINITGNASTIVQSEINSKLDVGGDGQTWDITEEVIGTQSGPLIVTYYNFSGITSPSTTHIARWASPAGSNRWLSGTEATTTQYQNMQTDNGVFADACADASNDEPFWRFNFTINEAESSIRWINVTFNGRENATESGTCYVYNFTSSAWTSMGAIPTSDGTRSVNYTFNLGYLINDVNRQFVIVCEGANFDPGDCIRADYVLVKVGYTPTVPIYSTSVEHNSTVSYSGTLNSINVSLNFTSTVNDVYNMTIYDFAHSQWDASPCQNQSITANNYYTIWCNVTTNPSNYNSSTGIVKVRLNSTSDTDQGTLTEEYVQYYIGYITSPSYANISVEHNSSTISEDPLSISMINVTTVLKTNISSGITFSFYIYNFSSNSWEQCSQASVNTTYRQMGCIAANPSNYISNSKIRIRLNSSSDITHQMMEDYLVYQIAVSSEYRMEVEHNATVSYSGTLNSVNVSINFSTNATNTPTFNFLIYNFSSGSWEICDTINPLANTWDMSWCNRTINPDYYSLGGVIRVRLNETSHITLAEVKEDYIQYYVTYTQ